MEENVWQLLVQVVTWLSSLYGSSSATPRPANGGASPSALESAAAGTSTSKNATTLAVTREKETVDGVFGSLKFNGEFNGEFICCTMENRALIIPAGQYGIEIYDSPHAGHPVPRLQNVPDRSEIEIHCGNQPCDSKGCIIVGLDHIGDTLERSRDAFNVLFPKISSALGKGPVQLQIF
jgi:hypothetical protein